MTHPDGAWPSVSVVMPCYNAAAYMADALASIQAQRYEGELEILVVDDGSTDASVRVAGSFSNVRVLTQKNRGPAAARNLGLAQARGEVLAFLDADDLWTEGSLNCRVEVLRTRAEVGVVFGNFTRWTPAPAPGMAAPERPDQLPAWALQAVDRGWVYPEILLDPIVHIIATAVRRSVVEAIGGFDETLRTGEDYDFFIRAARHCRFARVEPVVARYRQHAASITRIPQARSNEYTVVSRAIERFGLSAPDGRPLEASRLAQRLQRLCFDHALQHLHAGDPGIAAAGFRAAIRHDPMRAKAWLFAGLAAVKARLQGVRRTVPLQ